MPMNSIHECLSSIIEFLLSSYANTAKSPSYAPTLTFFDMMYLRSNIPEDYISNEGVLLTFHVLQNHWAN